MEEIKDCIFCKLIKEGKLEERTILKSEKFIAFLDAHPLVEGHTLVIPVEHKEWVWEVSNFEDYNNFSKEVANLLRERLNIAKIDVLVSGGTVPHAHIHLLPSIEGRWAKIKDYLREQRKEVKEPPSEETVQKLRQ